MHMGVDKSRHCEKPAPVDFRFPVVRLPGAGDPAAAHGNIPPLHLPRREMKYRDILNDQGSFRISLRLINDCFQILQIRFHAVSSGSRQIPSAQRERKIPSKTGKYNSFLSSKLVFSTERWYFYVFMDCAA